jgi:membrane fusion protein (multidrug efflux system)
MDAITHEQDARSGLRDADDSGDRENDTPKPSLRERMRQHPRVVIAIAVGLVVLIAVAIVWWLHARRYESSDDAFIDARTATISAQVSGWVKELTVNDNQMVHSGDRLLTLDSTTFIAQQQQSQAQVDQAIANVANIDAQIKGQQTRISQAQTQVEQSKAAQQFAQQEYNRGLDLVKTGAGTVQQAQQRESNLRQANATLSSANDAVTGAVQQLAVLRTQRKSADAQLEQAQAQLKLAQVNVGYTNIMAPFDGRVTKLTAAVGGYVAPGQALTMFVPRLVWVTANFKETQLALMSVGQPVDVTIDAYPGRHFPAHVDSIQAGSGTAFSLLPAENATGNYVKVVQRVPVKIVFEDLPDVELGPGMSVVPTVKVR